MKHQSQMSMPWPETAQNFAADVSRELRCQLTSLSGLSQWTLVPVIILTVAGLWWQMNQDVLLAWAVAALVQSTIGYLNNRVNAIRLEKRLAHDRFLLRNGFYYAFVGAVWGSLPLLAALWGTERAAWFALIIAMGITTALVLILSTSHRIFYGALAAAGAPVLFSIAIGPHFSYSLLMLGFIYMVALLLMHNTLFQVQLDRVRTSLRNAAHASALANTLEHHDALTGLYNLAGLKQWLRLMPGSDGSYRNVTIAIANVKGFSEINVLHGSSVADTLLVEIASRLVQLSGEKFGIARLSGAEFLLADVRPGADAEDVAQMLTSLEHEDYMIADRLVNISLQLSTVQGNADDIDSLIETARTRAQQGSQKAGLPRHEQARNLQLTRDLVLHFHDALLSDQITPWFQPIVNCGSNDIIGWEALVRWQHPEHGIILPEEFLDIARISGHATQLTRKMFRSAAVFASQLKSLGFGEASHISINFTASDLASSATLDWMRQILSEFGLDAEQMTVEISEKEALVQNAQFTSNLQQFRNSGIPLAIDDFGTGYANISHLLDLPASTVKLDKRFVEKLPWDKHSVALVRAIITMAKSMGMKTVAEGVERPEQLIFLRDNGCDSYQGFLAGLALPEKDASKFIKDWQSHTQQPNKAGDSKN